MVRRSNKEAILDAAESVVRRMGAAHMSLEAVAEEAGVSKGGLIYHFPSKEALLIAMVTRLAQRFDGLREEIWAELPDEPWKNVLVEVELMRRMTSFNDCLLTSLLAVAANQPKLLSLIRTDFDKRFECISRDPKRFLRMMVFHLAADGLAFYEMFGFSALSPEQRAAVLDEMRHMAEEQE